MKNIMNTLAGMFRVLWAPWHWFFSQKEKDIALCEAAGRGSLVETRILLAVGAHVDGVGPWAMQPLHFAAENGHWEVVELLLARQAGTDVPGYSDNTPLHLAAWQGHTKAVKLLLEAGARVDAVNDVGNQPLHLAAREGHADVADLLIAKGAKVDAANTGEPSPSPQRAFSLRSKVSGTWGERPLHMAVKRGHLAVVELLAKAGANPNAPDENGTRPLHVLPDGAQEIAKWLIERGADVDAANACGERPLHRAAWCGNTAIANVLIENGASVDAPGVEGNTPLHEAARLGRTDMVSLLLSRGSDPQVENLDGIRPEHLCRQADVKALLEKECALRQRLAKSWRRRASLRPKGPSL